METTKSLAWSIFIFVKYDRFGIENWSSGVYKVNKIAIEYEKMKLQPIRSQFY